MPHAGGGSNSGGFHSGSSGTTSIPKTDLYGNTHSRHYVRPGYYYGGMYVPYSRVHRGFNAVSRFIILLVVSIIFVVSGILAGTIKKTSSSLEDYSIDRYSEIYQKDSNYENNILIEIVAYDNLIELDYFPIVGDNVSIKIDEMFGNKKSYFGSKFKTELNQYKKKVNNLTLALTSSVKYVNDSISEKYCTTNKNVSKVINNTNYNLGSMFNELNDELNNFYNITGYNICVDVNYYDSAYKPNYILMTVFVLFGAFMLISSVVFIIKGLRAVKIINQEDKKGNLKEYYEGDVDYETQIKRYSMDKPFKYDNKEYEKLKKEFEKTDDFKNI